MVAAGDAGDGRQAQAASQELGRKERIEDSGLDLWPDASAGVSNGNVDVIARAHVPGDVNLLGANSGDAGPDRNHTWRLADRLSSVDHQICDDLLNLARIGTPQPAASHAST